MHIFIWLLDVSLTGTTTPGQSKPGSDGNERLLHIFQIMWTEASTSESLVSY